MFKRISWVCMNFGFALVLSGCFFVNMFDFGAPVDLAKHNWKISSFVLTGESYEAKNFEQTPSMRFDAKELKVYGNTGCNTFFASYAWLKDKKIEMRNSGMTRKMCSSPEAMEFEQKLMEEFDGEFEVIEEGQNLILKKPTLSIMLQPLNAPFGEKKTSEHAATSKD